MPSSDLLDTFSHGGMEAVTISAIFVSIAGVFVVLRCVSRFGLTWTYGSDDILMLFSLAFSLTFTVLIAARKYPSWFPRRR